MKKLRNCASTFFQSTDNSASAQRIAQAIVAVKENFTSDIFRLLKSQKQNLEIVYANMRV